MRVKGVESRSPGESVAGSVVGVRLGHENGLNLEARMLELGKELGIRE